MLIDTPCSIFIFLSGPTHLLGLRCDSHDVLNQCGRLHASGTQGNAPLCTLHICPSLCMPPLTIVIPPVCIPGVPPCARRCESPLCVCPTLCMYRRVYVPSCVYPHRVLIPCVCVYVSSVCMPFSCVWPHCVYVPPC